MQEEQDNAKGVEQCKAPDPYEDWASQHTPPRHSIGPQGKRQGGRQHTDGEASNTAALHSPCHPPSATPPALLVMAPPTTTTRGREDRGYPTTRTPRTHTHHPHTTHPAENSTRHDSSTRQHCSGMSGGTSHTTALGRTTAAHTTAIPHTEEDGHHPLIHSSLSLVHVHTTDDQC